MGISSDHLYSQIVRAKELKFRKRMFTSNHLSCFMCHMSQLVLFFSPGQSGETSRWRVCYQWGYPVKFFVNSHIISHCIIFVFVNSFFLYFQCISCISPCAGQGPRDDRQDPLGPAGGHIQDLPGIQVHPDNRYLVRKLPKLRGGGEGGGGVEI